MANITNEERERRQREQDGVARRENQSDNKETTASVRRDPGPDVTLGQESQAGGGGDPQEQLKQVRRESQEQSEETLRKQAEMKPTPTQEELDEVRMRTVGGLAYQTREAKPKE